MECDERNSLILTLADLFKGNQIETKTITKALGVLCHATSFECGLLYETGPTEELSLREQYPPDFGTVRKSLFVNDLISSPACFSEKPIYLLERSKSALPWENDVLSFFAVQSMILSPVMDDSARVRSFVVLLNRTCKSRFTEKDAAELLAPLSMLLRYVGVRMYKNEIQQAQLALGSVLDNTGIDIYVNDFYNHDILYVNQSMAAPYGGQANFLGKKCWEVLFPGQTGPCDFCPQKRLIDEQGMPTKVYTWDYQRPFDGSWFRVFSAAFQWADGRLAHVVSSADITDNKRNEALIEKLANYDQLTELPNRRMLLAECKRRIDNAEQKEQGYILFFDIDGFKSINDNYGHDAGDEFLLLLAEFFRSIPMLKNAIYRNGGDEFVAIVGGQAITKDNVQSLANFIHERFKRPWKLKKGDATCNTSIGVACYPEDGSTPDELLQKADMAMYLAKKSGGGKLCFGFQLKEEFSR